MAPHLTREGYEKLKQEYQYLKTVKRKEVIQAIQVAREKGDLRENAEYDAAKEAQAHLERRLAELYDQLTSVSILDDSQIDASKILIGAHAVLQDLASGKEVKYQFVAKEEADSKQGKLSLDSPMGRAFLGKTAGSEVEVQIPAGKLRYKILKIHR